MKPPKRLPERFLCGAMHCCWLYAWFAFLLYAVFNIPVSPLTTLTVYIMGCTAARIGQGGGIRRIWVLMIRLALFSAFWWWTITMVNPGTKEMHLTPRLDLWLLNPPGGWQVFCLVIVSILFTVIWQTGAALVLRPFGDRNVFICFDKGLAAFSLLLVIKLMLSAKGGIQIPYPGLIPLFILFFMFGFGAIGLVRCRHEGGLVIQRKFSGLGPAFGAVAGFFTALTVGFVLMESRLYEGAGRLSQILNSGAVPLLAWVERILKAWFGRKRGGMRLDTNSGGGSSLELGADMLQNGPAGFWEKAFGALLIILLAIIVVGGVGLVLWWLARYLYRYLGGRQPSTRRPGFGFGPVTLPAWLKNLLAQPVNGADMYRFLLQWGRFSGLAHRPAETPTEYAKRLSSAFPFLNVHFQTIASLFNEETYGPRPAATGRIANGKRAVRRLRHPRHLWRRCWKRIALS